MLSLLTSRGCTRCMVTKKLLQDKGIEFKDVDIMSDEGRELASKYSVMAAGTLIDEERGVVDVKEIAGV